MTTPESSKQDGIERLIEEAARKCCGNNREVMNMRMDEYHRYQGFREGAEWALAQMKLMSAREISQVTGKCNCGHRLCSICG